MKRSGDIGVLLEDENDVDEFGMDPHTRKRLKVKMKSRAKGSKRPARPMRTRMPYSLARVPKLGEDDTMEPKLRKRQYMSEAAPGGSGWTKIGSGGHPASLLEKAVGPYNKQVALAFVKLLEKGYYEGTLGKNYMGNGHVLLVGKGVNKSDLPIDWEFHVDHYGDEIRFALKYRTPQMDRQAVYRDSINGSTDPMPTLKRLASYMTRNT